MRKPAKILRILLKGLGGLLLLLVVLLAGAVLFLRTDTGLRFAVGMALPLLEEQGLGLTYDSISGPLPSRLRITGLRMTDSEGIWLAADDVEVRMHPLALFSGTLDIGLLRLGGTRVARQPVLPPAEPEPAAESSGGFSLPFAVNLQRLDVEDARVAESLIAPPPAVEDPATNLAEVRAESPTARENTNHERPIPAVPAAADDLIQGDSIRADIGGSAGISGGNPTFFLKGSISTGHDERLLFFLALDQGSALRSRWQESRMEGPSSGEGSKTALPPELWTFLDEAVSKVPDVAEPWLAARIDGTLVPGGVLATLTGDSTLPGGALVLNGVAPLSDWTAGLSFAVVDKDTRSPLRGGGNFRMAVSESQGFLFFQGERAVTADIALRLEPGNGYAELPAGLGPTLDLSASANGTTTDLTASLDAHTTAWHIGLRNLSMTNDSGATTVTGRYGVSVPDLAALTSSQASGSSGNPARPTNSVPPPAEGVGAMTGNSVPSAVPLSLDGSLDLTLENGGDVTTSTEGTLVTRWNSADHNLAYTIAGDVRGNTAALRRLSVTGLGLEASGTAAVDLDLMEKGGITAEFIATGADNAMWQTLVNTLINLDPVPERTGADTPEGGTATVQEGLGGSFALVASARPEGGQTTGALNLTTRDMRWPSLQLASLMGGAPHIALEFSGGGPLPWQARLVSLEAAALTATANIHLEPDTALASPASPSVAPGASLTTGTPIQANATPPLYAAPNDLLPSSGLRGRIKADANIAVPDISLLAEGFSGAATLAAQADGPLDDIAARLALASAYLHTPSGEVHDLNALVSSTIRLPESKATSLSLSGHASLDASDTPGGPLAFEADWTVEQIPANIRLAERTTETAGRPGGTRGPGGNDETGESAPGSVLKVAVTEVRATGAGAELSGGINAVLSQPPALSGDVRLAVSDWNRLSALAGTPLSGGNTEVVVRLSPEGDQTVSARIDAQNVASGDSFAIAGLSGTLDVRGLFGTPQPVIDLRTGQGNAGPLDWQTGRISLADSGAIDILFNGRSLPKRPGESAPPKGVPAFKSTDRVAVKGALNMDASTLTLDSLVVYLAKPRVGARLSQRAMARFAPDIALEGFRLDLAPGGHVALDGHFSTDRTTLDASINQLPLSLLQAVANTGLPTGELNLSTALNRANGRVNGNFDVNGWLSNNALQDGSNFASLAFTIDAATSDRPGGSFRGVRPLPGVAYLAGGGSFSPASGSGRITGTAGTTATGGPATPSSTAGQAAVSSGMGAASSGGSGQYGNMRFDIPLRFSASGIPLPATDLPFGFSFRFDGPMAALWQAVPLPDRNFSGNGLITAELSGTLNKPAGDINAYISNGLFEDHVLGILLKDITLEAGNDPEVRDGIGVRALLTAADTGGGTVAMEALVGPKYRLINSSVARSLAMRSGNEAQKIAAREIQEARVTQNATADRNNLARPGADGPDYASSPPLTEEKSEPPTGEEKYQNPLAGGENPELAQAAQREPGRGVEEAAGDAAARTRQSRRRNWRPITSLSDGRIGPTDMCIAVRAQVDRLEPLHRDDISVRLSGLMGVEGPLGAPYITGDILVQEAEVLLETLSPGGSVTTLPITNPDDDEAAAGPGPSANIHIGIPGRVFIRGFGLDSEWEGELEISGRLARPSLAGSLRPVQGRFDLLSRPFDFNKGEVFFLGGSGAINPGLDLELVNRTSDLEAFVRITGSAASPQLALDSIPSLPQDEIVSRVLFGKSASSLSRYEAMQLAGAVRQLMGAGDAGIFSLSSFRQRLGIDVLRVDSGNDGNDRHLSSSPGTGNIPGAPGGGGDEDTGNTSIEAGKYIMDNVYLGIQQDVRGGTGVRVDVELSPKISVQGSSNQQSSQVGVGWKLDY